LLTASAISPATATARGYQWVLKKAELATLGFKENQRRVPALLIPIHDVAGEVSLYQLRPNAPRIDVKGKAIKYETPTGAGMVVDVPPQVRPWVRDPEKPLFITEGARKADAACRVRSAYGSESSTRRSTPTYRSR
jgi:hypothetical protein